MKYYKIKNKITKIFETYKRYWKNDKNEEIRTIEKNDKQTDKIQKKFKIALKIT